MHCGRPDRPARSAPRRDLRSSLDGGNTFSHPPADSYRLSWTARFLVRAALVLRSTSRRQRLDVCFCWAREVSTRRQWRQWISCTTPVCGTELAPTCLAQCAPDECTDLPGCCAGCGTATAAEHPKTPLAYRVPQMHTQPFWTRADHVTAYD